MRVLSRKSLRSFWIRVAFGVDESVVEFKVWVNDHEQRPQDLIDDENNLKAFTHGSECLAKTKGQQYRLASAPWLRWPRTQACQTSVPLSVIWSA